MKFSVIGSLFFSVFLVISPFVSLAKEIPEGFIFHEVQAGDVFSKIAPPKHWDLIRRVNRIDNRHLILGKKILIPADWEKASKFLPVPEYLAEARKLKRAVYIFLDAQYFGAYENGQLVFWGPVSSGKKGYTTPKGTFEVLWKKKFYHSKKYDADMPFALNISNDGYFLHEKALPGRPASHGCVRLLRSDAKRLFDWAKRRDRVVLI